MGLSTERTCLAIPKDTFSVRVKCERVSETDRSDASINSRGEIAINIHDGLPLLLGITSAVRQIDFGVRTLDSRIHRGRYIRGYRAFTAQNKLDLLPSQFLNQN